MPELLFELGCEELPATFVKRAYQQLGSEIANGLKEAGLSFESLQTFGTPRRLVVSILGIPAQQSDATKEVRGPAAKNALDQAGQPTGALIGFCKGQGVDPANIRIVGDYVYVDKFTPGRATSEVLADVIPAAIRALTFDKSMRWGQSRMRFARPIRWMLAAFDGQVVDAEIEGVKAGITSRGHRFYSRQTFEATDLETYLTEVRNHCVEPFAEKREATIRAEAAKACTGTPDLPEGLVEENVFLTEWPSAIEGTFKEEYLELPECVLVTAMAKHERFFPVRDADHRLTNRFISIRNAGEDDAVRAGNEWVLNARFNDAKFFSDDDHKYTLDDFLKRTERMLFQEKLGTVRQRIERLEQLSEVVAQTLDSEHNLIDDAQQAAKYCKADLSSGLVSELPSLQGQIGAEYAARSGFKPEVCQAIAAHYSIEAVGNLQGEARVIALCLLISDQIDKLGGYLGLGLAPTGSSDPFALRRAVTFLIESVWNVAQKPIDFMPLLDRAMLLFNDQGLGLREREAREFLLQIFEQRYPVLMPNVRDDILRAAMEPGDLTNPWVIRNRVAAIEMLSSDLDFIQTAMRPQNIVAAAEKKGINFSTSLGDAKSMRAALASAEGEVLLTLLDAQVPAIVDAIEESGRPEAAVDALKALQPAIHNFFESTMIMSENEAERQARLTLAGATSSVLKLVGSWSAVAQVG